MLLHPHPNHSDLWYSHNNACKKDDVWAIPVWEMLPYYDLVHCGESAALYSCLICNGVSQHVVHKAETNPPEYHQLYTTHVSCIALSTCQRNETFLPRNIISFARETFSWSSEKRFTDLSMYLFFLHHYFLLSSSDIIFFVFFIIFYNFFVFVVFFLAFVHWCALFE